MKAKPQPAPRPETDITIRAVATFTTSDSFLCEAIELEIVNGVVVSHKMLTRAPDLPAVAIGAAQRQLWGSMRANKQESRR